MGTDACSKSKLESNQTKYSVDCGDLSDRCIRQENEVLDIKGINAACATQGLCESLKTACDKLDTSTTRPAVTLTTATQAQLFSQACSRWLFAVL